jgi:hypothetical protein
MFDLLNSINKRAFVLLQLMWLTLFNHSFANTCIYKWSGAVTENAAAINFKLQDSSNYLQVKIDTSINFTSAFGSYIVQADTSNNNIYKCEFQQLQPHTKYYYAVFDSGILVPNSLGSFNTASYSPHTFRFAFGSCITSSNHPVFNVIDNLHPNLMLFTGDLHYLDPNSTNINAHRYPYELTLQQAAISSLLQHTPIAYVWDDHDFTCNNCDGTSIGKHSAYTAYQQIVPHYALTDTGIDVAIHQSFNYGRVHFILSDTRSERLNGIHIMTAQQMQWLKNEFIVARNNHQMSVWISSVSFNGVNQTDNWAEFTAQREELANFWRDSAIANILILSGDAHMLAIDNGTNNHYETDSINPHQYPIFQAAALNRGGSVKGGSFSEGTYPNPTYNTGQFGIVDVIDSGGDSICFELKGYRTDSVGMNTNVVVSYNFCRDLVNDNNSSEVPEIGADRLFSVYFSNNELHVKNLLSDSAIIIEVIDATGRINKEEIKIQPSTTENIRSISNHGVVIIKATSFSKTETRKVSF